MQPLQHDCRADCRPKLSELVAMSFGFDGCVEEWTTPASSLREESLVMTGREGYRESRSRVSRGRSTVRTGGRFRHGVGNGRGAPA